MYAVEEAERRPLCYQDSETCSRNEVRGKQIEAAPSSIPIRRFENSTDTIQASVDRLPARGEQNSGS